MAEWGLPAKSRLHSEEKETCSEAGLPDFHGCFYVLVLPLVPY